jgi:hypothetical protein
MAGPILKLPSSSVAELANANSGREVNMIEKNFFISNVLRTIWVDFNSHIHNKTFITKFKINDCI